MEVNDIGLLDLDRFAEGAAREWSIYLRNNAPGRHRSDTTLRCEGLQELRRNDAGYGTRLAHLG